MVAKNDKLPSLPVGLQTFEKIRVENFIYVDKTDLVHSLVNSSSVFFLSRPRRFGKSLLVSTIKSYFEGRQDLFKGLTIDKLEPSKDDGGWQEYPIFYFDFSIAGYQTDGLKKLHAVISKTLNEIERIYQLKSIKDDVLSVRLSSYIQQVSNITGKKVVILVDEYDAPLNANIEDEKPLSNEIIREFSEFFGVLKNADPYLRFVFITGIARFSKVILFSKMNQLKDITMSPKYSAICGITDEELKTYFFGYIKLLANYNHLPVKDTYAKLKREYDGFDFTGSGLTLYNPFSLLNVLDDGVFGHYWFGPSTPTVLVNELQKSHFDYSSLEKKIVRSSTELSQYRSGDPDPIPLLFQTGYLTIDEILPISNSIRLRVPNNEVRIGLLSSYLKYLNPHHISGVESSNLVQKLIDKEYTDFFDTLRSFFSNIPYDLNNKTEKDFETLFYAIITILGANVRVERHTAVGASDAVVELPEEILIFEFKLQGNGTPESAIKQIKSKGYADPYLHNPKEKRPIKLFGVSFDSEHRTIGDWKQEVLR